jgi:hypothetical protein
MMKEQRSRLYVINKTVTKVDAGTYSDVKEIMLDLAIEKNPENATKPVYV